MKRSKRFEVLEKRPINFDGFSDEWIEAGLIAMNSPHDPKPSIKIQNEKIVEMDGKKESEFDSIDIFIARYAINIEKAEKYMDMDDVEIARMIVDINISREKIIDVATSLTPAKLSNVMTHLNMVEIIMGQMKMRCRKKIANKAHVTNLYDNPILMAADSAEAALRGFSEIETTAAVSRYAPFNALALLVGGMAVRKGILSQCSLEESMELKLGMKGLTTYAETVSVYGTEAVLTDGDDTPWSKGFLASIYASRGMKMSFTSGTGSEVLMGNAEKKSMLYLESRCLYIAKGCGTQGVQNGAVSCIGVPASVPGGFKAIAAENLMASMLNLEVASGNDQTFTHSDMRRMSKLFPQFLAGTDFITSGYSAVPNKDNMFAGSNMDCNDYDDWYVLQRDMKIDGGIVPVEEEKILEARKEAVEVLRDLFQGLDLPEITEEEISAAIFAYSSEDMPKRNMVEDLKMAEEFRKKNITGLKVAKILYRAGHTNTAENILFMIKQKVAGDYLQTGAIFNEKGEILSSLNNENKYNGPTSGYKISLELWKQIIKKEGVLDSKDF